MLCRPIYSIWFSGLECETKNARFLIYDVRVNAFEKDARACFCPHRCPSTFEFLRLRWNGKKTSTKRCLRTIVSKGGVRARLNISPKSLQRFLGYAGIISNSNRVHISKEKKKKKRKIQTLIVRIGRNF